MTTPSTFPACKRWTPLSERQPKSVSNKQKKESRKKELRLPCTKTETLLYAQQNSELMQIRTGERKGSTTAPEYSQKWSPGTNHSRNIFTCMMHACPDTFLAHHKGIQHTGCGL